MTCPQFRDEVVAVARGLVAAGIEPGDRVALMSRTRYEWTLLDYAIWAAGAVTVPIYETSSAEQVAWILADSGAVACVVETTAHARPSPAVRDRLPRARTRLADRRRRPRRAGRRAAPRSTRDEVEQRRRTAPADDLATIIYTSGTTGRPKGCVLTHRNMYSDIANAIPVLPNLFHARAPRPCCSCRWRTPSPG